MNWRDLFLPRSRYVSLDWLRQNDRQTDRDGWQEAPRIDWTRYSYSGPRRREDAPQSTIRVRVDV